MHGLTLPKKQTRSLPASLKDILLSILTLAAATGMGFLFECLGFSEANIITVYILGVLVTAVFTARRVYSLVFAPVSVLVFNFFFTVPRFTLNAYDSGYPATFLIMFLAALITGNLAAKIKRTAHEKEQAAQLAKNEQLRANLLRSISHDLRTPLTSISGNAGILLSSEEEISREKRTQLYTHIYDDSLWLINLVENLLSVTKIEDGTMGLHFTAELVEEVIAEALRHVGRKNIEHQIRVEQADDLIMAKMDARLIVQVLINLVDNAVKYTPVGSKICIAVNKADGRVQIDVADDGPGIPNESKSRIFDMFYTAAAGVADSRRSLGLGLALCKSIVTAHGGEIWLRDNKPTGTVFSFTLTAEEVTLHE